MTDRERYDRPSRSGRMQLISCRRPDGFSGPLNNLFIMASSGARGNKSQISQVGGKEDLWLMTGHTVEIPIKANFREGLSKGVLHFCQMVLCKWVSGYSATYC